jgi:hypothetical protein
MRTWIVLSFALASTLGFVPVAGAEGLRAANKGSEPAPAPLYAEVVVLHATNSGKGIDPRIGQMPELRKPPFSAYDTYVLLERARLPLVKGNSTQLPLPNGWVLETQLGERVSADEVRFSAAVTKPNGKEFLPLLKVKARIGQRFVVAGQSHKKGILVLVVRPVR